MKGRCEDYDGEKEGLKKGESMNKKIKRREANKQANRQTDRQKWDYETQDTKEEDEEKGIGIGK